MNKSLAGRHAWLLGTGLLLVSFLAVSERAAAAQAAQVRESAIQVWRVDSARSYADFQILALAMIPIRGRFSDLAGAVSRGSALDTVNVVVPMSGLRMRSPEKRRWALSDAFFDAPRFPEIQFESSLPQHADSTLLQVGDQINGQLTMHGQTASQTFTLTRSNCTISQPAPCELDLEAEIQRSRFGLDRHSFTLADTVSMKITLYLEPMPP